MKLFVFQQAQLQAGTLGSLTDTSNHNDANLQRNISANISAIATSLMNSAQQFTQQQQQQQAAGIYTKKNIYLSICWNENLKFNFDHS